MLTDAPDLIESFSFCGVKDRSFFVSECLDGDDATLLYHVIRSDMLGFDFLFFHFR